MRGRRKRNAIAFVGAIAIFLALAAGRVSTAPALEYEEVPARVAPAPITASRLPRELPTGAKTFTFSVSSGFCLGGPKPRIDHVRVVERRQTAERRFKSTVITAYLLYPAQQLVIPPSPPPSNVVYNACADLGLELSKRVKLKRSADQLTFFDGSRQPPRRIWPPGKS